MVRGGGDHSCNLHYLLSLSLSLSIYLSICVCLFWKPAPGGERGVGHWSSWAKQGLENAEVEREVRADPGHESAPQNKIGRGTHCPSTYFFYRLMLKPCTATFFKQVVYRRKHGKNFLLPFWSPRSRSLSFFFLSLSLSPCVFLFLP